MHFYVELIDWKLEIKDDNHNNINHNLRNERENNADFARGPAKTVTNNRLILTHLFFLLLSPPPISSTSSSSPSASNNPREISLWIGIENNFVPDTIQRDRHKNPNKNISNRIDMKFCLLWISVIYTTPDLPWFTIPWFAVPWSSTPWSTTPWCTKVYSPT